jgi:hypothetical protein
MATVEKDFKVKNGLQVALGGSFGGAVEVGAPTLAHHAATKEYVDALTGSMTVSNTPPSSPTNGTQWFDTLTQRVNVYYEGSWLTTATIDDTLNLPQHIHDTAIDGSGLIVSTFIQGGGFNSPQGSPVDGGGPSTTSFALTLDGGSAVDNFN